MLPSASRRETVLPIGGTSVLCDEVSLQLQ